MGIGSSKIKYIQSLKLKKFRDRYQVFVAEGDKIVRELLQSTFQIKLLCALHQWIDHARDIIPEKTEVISVSTTELERISTLKTPNQVLAVVEKPSEEWSDDLFIQGPVLALDDLRDPGNLGTIIRTADWFGIRHIFCSPSTTDIYSPKVIQATMGSFLRVRLHYTPLPALISGMQHTIPVYGASLAGRSMYEYTPEIPAMLVIGNESAGISQEVSRFIKQQVKIPSSFMQGGEEPNEASTAESLNAAVAAGILMAWLHGASQKH